MEIKVLVYLLLTTLAFAAADKIGGPIHLPLYNRRHPENGSHEVTTLDHLQNSMLASKSKYAINHRIFKKRNEDEIVPLTRNTKADDYYAMIEIGTPGEVFSVSIDTGSADLWVPGVECFGEGKTIYYPESSDTSDIVEEDTASSRSYIKYGRSVISGWVYKDTVIMGDLTVTGQEFLVCEMINADYSRFEADGVIGMAFKSAASLGMTPFFYKLVDQLGIKPIFGLYFSRNIEGSQLTLGGYDESIAHRKDDFTIIGPHYNKVLQKNLWTIRLDSIQVNREILVKFSSHDAVIDTGTDVILAPNSIDAAKIYKGVPNTVRSLVRPGYYYSFPCDNIQIFRIKFGGIEYQISSMDFIFQKDPLDPNHCLGTMVDIPDESSSSWIFGLPFLKNVYTVFDMSQGLVGFTSLANNPQDSVSTSEIKVAINN